MTKSEFQLNIAQVETVIKSCRSKFSTKRHQDTYDNLIELFEATKKNYSNFNIDELRFCRNYVLDKIYSGIEFLHYNNKKEVPKHLISCMELCLNDWITNPSFYSITFSHNSTNLQDFVTLTLRNSGISRINMWTKLNLGVEYKHGLIQISQPRFFNADFMSNVPCYHELGHFIESFYNIIDWVRQNKIGFEYELGRTKITNKGNLADSETNYVTSYMTEHFCDIFAAQYIGNLVANNLVFIAENHNYSGQHPSTDRRKSVIEAFLTGSGSTNDLEIVQILKEATIAQTNRFGKVCELKNDRSPALSFNPFIEKRVVKLVDKNEIHNLIVEGWEYFMATEHGIEPLEKLKFINKTIRGTIELTLLGEKYYSPKKILSRLLN